MCAVGHGNVLQYCNNYGKISASEATTYEQSFSLGGLAGWGNGLIAWCKNYGDINFSLDGNYYERGSGGICGNSINLTINDSCNFANINSKGSAGGILGISDDENTITNINRCYNTGNVTADLKSAGIIGWGKSVNINDCYNSGTINGGEYAGGITAWYLNENPINRTYNVGIVNGSNSVGSLVGYCTSSIYPTACYTLSTSATYAVGTGTGTGWGTINKTGTTDWWINNLQVLDDEGMREIVTSSTNGLGDNWTYDEAITSQKWKYNDGYPILKWQRPE